jgi:hydroxymethylglutaryl-CoA lyase
MAQKIEITEVGPRDGLQIARDIMKTDDKIRWIESLAAAGIEAIEVGSFVPPKLVPQMADTDTVVRSVVKSLPGVQIVALAPNRKGVERAYDADAHIVVMPISVTEGHSRANTNKSTFEAVAEFRRSAEWLRGQPRPTRIEAGCSMSFGCSIDGIVPVSRVVEVAVALADAGADAIALADTVGYADPTAIRQKVRAV